MANEHYAGTSGDMTFAGTALRVTSWSATDTTELLRTTDKADGGYHYSVAGIKQLNISFEANYDATVNPGDPPLVRSGIEGTFDLELPDTNSLSGTCKVSEVSYSSDVAGVVTYTGTAESQGQYYGPGEATS